MKSKQNYAARLCLLVIGFITVAAFNSYGQNGPASLTVEDYKKYTSFKIESPEEDTYIKFESTYILDREAKPYVFNYSDGVERKIYVYKMLKGANRDEVGTMAMYAAPKSGKTIKVCIPGAGADKKVWDYYIDELKLNGEQEKGFLSTLAFVLSREYSHEHANAGKGSTVAKENDDYDFCFPGGALVALADGTAKPIEQVKAGDKVVAFDVNSRGTRQTTVTGVQAHYKEEGIQITKLVLLPTEEIFASADSWTPATPIEIESTGNHPIYTKDGKKEMRQIEAGDILYHFDSSMRGFREYRVVAKVLQEQQLINQVYNLETEAGNYLVNGTVVLDK
ncbi:Hint domain-containing protein [Pontibacter harenae]|uniref:Hint domain-containing protein n=1 Tax=Pontibacter harenae TaxID=2894083 RepID=UPI001E377109|nr:Hint domain-containing protein [Pontibacter harenae]MCC9167858.1 Hint domain-containing protein [Pontibacter harenae]